MANELQLSQEQQRILDQAQLELARQQHEGSIPLQQLSQQPLSQAAEAARNEEPWFVNSKQYHRIMRRREARQKIIEKSRPQGFVYESRHQHARKRIRGPGGRFLSSVELNALKKYGRIQDGVILPRGSEEPDPELAKLDSELANQKR